jgi:predicted nucleic acid-binding protein
LSRRSPEPARWGVGARRRAAALIVYFDTSAVIKLLVLEEDSQLADELWSRASMRFSSWLIYPEACAALAAAARARRINPAQLRRTRADLDEACASMQLIGVDDRLAASAGGLAERHALCGYDAVHLATAMAIGDAELLLVTWDRDLGAAALREGRSTAPR